MIYWIFNNLQLSPKGSPRSKRSISPPNTAGSSSVLSLSAFNTTTTNNNFSNNNNKNRSTSLTQLQVYDKEDDEGVRMMWEEGRTLKTLQNVYGPSIQRAFVDRIIADSIVGQEDGNRREKLIPVISNGLEVEQQYYQKQQEEIEEKRIRQLGIIKNDVNTIKVNDGDEERKNEQQEDLLHLLGDKKKKKKRKKVRKMKRVQKTTWQEMMYQSAWEKGVKMNMHQTVSHATTTSTFERKNRNNNNISRVR